jgi:hypothetical protein
MGPAFRPMVAPRRLGRGPLYAVALVVVCLGDAASAFAQAGIVLQSGNVSFNTGNNASPLTFSHTVLAGSNLAIVVGVASQGTNRTVTGVSWGADTLTSLGTAADRGMGFNGRAELFGKLLGTLTMNRTSTVSITFAGTNVKSAAGAMGFSGVGAIGSSVPANGSSQTPAVTVTSTATGDFVVDVMANNDVVVFGSPTGAGQNERWDQAMPTAGRGAQSTRPGTATSTAMSWMLDMSRAWVIVGAPLKDTDATTAVRFDGFDAHRQGPRVRLGWRTGLEIDNLGFNVYREHRGQRVRVTPSPVAGSALLAGAGISWQAGRHYQWEDQWAEDGVVPRYWLEEIDLWGRRRWHGPATPVTRPLPRPGTASTSPTLEGMIVERAGPGSATAVGSAPAPVRVAAKPGTRADRFKVRVTGEAIYRVTRSELTTAGLPAETPLDLLSLWRDGREVAMRVDGDVLELFATGSDTPWSGTGVYWLVVGPPGGARWTKETPPDLPASAEPGFADVAERRDRSLYFAALRNGDRENFFGPLIGPAPAEISLELPGVQPAFAAAVEVALQGVTEVEHRVGVALNGQDLGEVRLSGRDAHSLRVMAPGNLLHHGDNRITLSPLGGEQDLTVVDRVRVEYVRELRARGDHLRFLAPSGRSTSVDGFTGPEVRVFDVTDAASPRELAARASPVPTEDGAAASYRVTVGVPASNAGVEPRRLLAVHARLIQPVPSLVADPPTGWAEARDGADILIVTHGSLASALAPLRALREAEGWTVAVADVEDVYDDFTHGNKTPHAIRALVETARTRWRRPPRFLLLVGDATFDPRDHLGRGAFDLVPTRLVDTRLHETASDDWFVVPPGRDLAEVAVGRLTVRTVEEAQRVVAKIVAFGRGAGRERRIFSYADHPSTIDFEEASRAALEPLAPGVTLERLWRREAGERTREALLGGLGAGPLVVNYFGHGSEDLWAGSVLTSADAATVGNRDRPWLLVAMTCLNAVFQDVFKVGIAESLLLAERAGAVAVWASSSLTYPVEHATLDRELMGALFVDRLTVGEATLRAKAQVTDEDVRRSWVLLGDPATRFTDPVPTDGGAAPRPQGRSCAVGGGEGRPLPLGLAAIAVVVCARRARRRRRRPR